MSFLRKAASRIVQVIERMDYRIHRPQHCANPQYDEIRKQHGMYFFRRAWWQQILLEQRRSVQRYARQFDWAVQRPSNHTEQDILPPHGRLMVIHLGHLGDMLHLVPTLQAVKRQRPDIAIELITGPWNKSILQSFETVFTAVHEYTPDVIQLHRGNRSAVMNPVEEIRWIETITGRGVDTVFCPGSPHYAEAFLIAGLKPVHYVGGEWPLEHFEPDFKQHTLPFDSKTYELDSIADFLPVMGLERDEVKLNYAVHPTSENNVDTLLSKQLNLDTTPLLTVFPGSGWEGKCWPPEKFSEVLNRLSRQLQFQILLCGSPAEKELCDHIADGLQPHGLNLAGLLTIDESAALIKRSSLLLGNDSLPIHLAAALHCPTVSLWGPTFPEKWAPRGDEHIAVTRKIPCDACVYWHPAAPCRVQPNCIATVDLEEVENAILSMDIFPEKITPTTTESQPSHAV